MVCICSKCGRSIQNKQALRLHEASCKGALEKVADESPKGSSDNPISERPFDSDNEELSLGDIFENHDKVLCSECGCTVGKNDDKCKFCGETFE